jgi:DNA polymerase-3 subunit epsilon
MRQIVLDTETTGLEPAQGHRIIEIGCVELMSRRPTGATFHRYLNPGRDVDMGAVEVHGITAELLADKPAFADVAEELLAFLEGAELLIHNAPFDVGFLDHELRLLGKGWGCLADRCTVVDTLLLARGRHPGQKNSLDALCRRYGVDDSRRELHGALLDAQLLAEVYLAMTGGQVALQLAAEAVNGVVTGGHHRRLPADRPPLAVIEPSAEELAAHGERLADIDRQSGGACLWKVLEEGAEAPEQGPA